MKVRLRAPITYTLRRRVRVLDTTLYMRPIRVSRIGPSIYTQGIPCGEHLILYLTCGHVVVRPQTPPTLRRLIRCDMCYRLWSERQREQIRSERRKQERSTDPMEIPIMAKKSLKLKAKKSAKKEPTLRQTGTKIYKYLKAPKDDVSSVQALAITYEAIKKAGTASVADLTKSAGAKIANISVIDPQTLIGVMLRKLLHRGVVAEVREDGKAAPAKKSKVVVAAKSKKKSKVKIKAKASKRAASEDDDEDVEQIEAD